MYQLAIDVIGEDSEVHGGTEAPGSKMDQGAARGSVRQQRLTTHGSRLTAHDSQLTTHNSRLTAHGSRLTTNKRYTPTPTATFGNNTNA